MCLYRLSSVSLITIHLKKKEEKNTQEKPQKTRSARRPCSYSLLSLLPTPPGLFEQELCAYFFFTGCFIMSISPTQWMPLREARGPQLRRAHPTSFPPQKRSSSVSSCLSSRSTGSSGDSCCGTWAEAAAPSPPRSSSEVLAALAVSGSGAAATQPVCVDHDDGACADDDAAVCGGWGERKQSQTTTAAGVRGAILPPPPPPLPPPSVVLPVAAAAGEGRRKSPGNFRCVEDDAQPVMKARPRVETNVPPPCPALFQHMEGSPHGMQLHAAQSPRAARRHEASRPTQALPSLTSPPENTGDAARVCAGLAPHHGESTGTSGRSGAPQTSSTGSSNGLSARTVGAPPSPLLLSKAIAPTPSHAADAPHALRPTSAPLSPFDPLPVRGRRGSAGTPTFSPVSGSNVSSLPPSPASDAASAPYTGKSRFSIPGDAGGGVPRWSRPPSLYLTSPRPPSSSRRPSSGYVSPLTDYGGDALNSIPATPLSSSSPFPFVPPLDFTGISDGPLVRDGEVSEGTWWRGSDDASGMLSPGVGVFAATAASSTPSGYDEDDDESEDEFADYRPRWRKEEERRLMAQQQRSRQLATPVAPAPARCFSVGQQQPHNTDEVSSSDDYIVPGYNDGAGGVAVADGHKEASTRPAHHRYMSRAAAAYASRGPRGGQSRGFWAGGSDPRGMRAGAAATGWMASLRRYLSIAGTWLARFLAIYLSSLLILRARAA